MTDFASRHAFVTGGAKGIGEAIVAYLLDLDYRVSFTYRSTPPPEYLTKKENALALQCDVTDQESLDAALAAAEERFGTVYALVANAGATRDTLVLRMSEEDFRFTMETNLVSSFNLTKRVLANMVRAREGRIVYISSVVALMGSAGQVNYAASKAGLIGMARSLAREVASRSITVNVIAPGAIETDILKAAGESRNQAILNQIPAKRLGKPEEVAATVGFLLSENAGYVTGTVLSVDGGLAMGI